MSDARPFTTLLSALPASVPFVAPEALERRRGELFELRLGANESTFGPSPRALAAMRNELERASLYGDPESFELRTALSVHLGLTREHLVIGSGIDDLLGLAVRAFLEPGSCAVTSLGAYPTFNYHVAGYGGRIESVPYRDDRNDLDALVDAARRHAARLLYLANPDNPTGSYHDAAAIAALLDALPEQTLLLLDEAYIEFAPPALPFDAEDPRVIRLRTFSKAYGMAGMRIGYAIAPRQTIAAFDKVRLHFGVNRVAQAGALSALADRAFLEGVLAEVAWGREEYTRLATALGLAALASATNFMAFDLGSPERARAVAEGLTARRVFVRVPGATPLNRLVRATVGTPSERRRFGHALEGVLKSSRV
ncbi:aminotransferase class I/II-fold pyridoxal phosphate-dependent enzyme [bacterium]|nr:MAG: aminotransferase class I/II-fold pyridoxal phosphate-dependent enzyme [bacterium]